MRVFAVPAGKYSSQIGGLCFFRMSYSCGSLRTELEQFARVVAVPAVKFSSLIGGFSFQNVLQLREPLNRDKTIRSRICCTGREELFSDWWVLF